MKIFRFFLRLMISTIVFFLTLFAVEIIIEYSGSSFVSTLPSTTQLCGDCGYIYEPKVGVVDVNSQGLRGPEISVEKPNGTFRILAAGDSVTFGARNDETNTYPRRLEALLREKENGEAGGGPQIEVLNGGVVGFTPYNEARYLEEKLMRFNPDLVIFQTCMNDMVNPFLHWNYLSRIKIIPPKEAFSVAAEIPPDALAGDAALQRSFIRRSNIFSMLRLLWLELVGNSRFGTIGTTVNGKFWPTYLSGESQEEIRGLLDYDSEKWRWFRKEILRARKAVGDSVFVLLVVPLAYELEEDYPFKPEELFLRFCREEKMICIDLREKLHGFKPEDIFILGKPTVKYDLPDVWHFNRNGAEVVAKLVKEFLLSNQLVRESRS